MERWERLIGIFEDTKQFYTQNTRLAEAVRAAKAAAKLYEADDYAGEPAAKGPECRVTVTGHKTFEAAMRIHAEHPEWKTAVLNFASAVNPGGGVENAPKTISPEEQYRLHLRRAKHILHIAAVNDADALVLGAFGCGAFRNDPQAVAKAYADVLAEYKGYFRYIEFAVYYQPGEIGNYEAFRCVL